MIAEPLRPPSLGQDANGVVSDCVLLRRFRHGDEAAFSELVRRHSALVLGVCRRVLRDFGDAEDAFQATFLVLARKANSVVWQDSIAGWLHQTALRAAKKLRASSTRRQRVEIAGAQADEPEATSSAAPPAQAAVRELAEVLDAELAALPARFREVILLCQVEGLRRDEAARRLGISVAAVKDRLERGRDRLQARLIRRGITLSAAAIAGWLIPGTAQAGAALTATTVQTAGVFVAGPVAAAGSVPTAISLAQGVLNMMGLEKLKYVAVVVASLFVGGIALGMLQDDPHRLEKGLRGTVVAVQNTGAKPHVTVELDEYAGVKLNLDMAVEAKVWTAFEAGKLADLKPGQLVSLRLAKDDRTVNEIHIVGQQREVVIRSATASQITVVDADEEEEGRGEPQEFPLAEGVIVRIGGLPANPDDLRPGMRVPLEFSASGRTVNAIESDDRAHIVQADIVLVDAPANVIKIRREVEDDQLIEEFVTVAANALVRVDGQPAKLADVLPKSEATLRLSPDRGLVRALLATSPEKDDDER